MESHSAAGRDGMLASWLEHLADAEGPDGMLQIVLEHTHAYVAAVSVEGRLLYMNRTDVGRDSDVSVAEVQGRDVTELIDEDSAARAKEAFARAAAERKTTEYTAHRRGSDGALSTYLTRVTPVEKAGEVIALVLVSTDVSEMARMKAELRENRDAMALALRATGIGCWTLDVTSGRIEFDDAVARLHGVHRLPSTPAAYVDQHVHPEDRAGLLEAFEGAHASCRPHVYRVTRPDGEVRWLLARVAKDAQADSTHRGCIIDHTERRMRDEQLREAHKLDAVGQLAGGIAHNFNNALAAIQFNVQLAKEEGAPEEAVECLDEALKAVDSAASLVEALSIFSQQKPFRAKRQPLAPIVERVARVCRATFGQRIQVEVEAREQPMQVDVDVSYIEKALLNICVNARDALESVTTAAVPRIRLEIERSSDDDPTMAGAAVIRIRDNGCGMTEEVRRRVFEPFFTTKHLGRGNGLGLSTAHGVVVDHGGRLTCESKPEEGTVFTIHLPLASGRVTPPPAAPPSRPSAVDMETAPRLLLVDDDPRLRRSLARLLRRAGYDVDQCVDGLEAMQVLERGDETYALAIVDAAMPRMSGAELLAWIEANVEDLPVVMLTGLVAPEIPPGAAALLRKPVRYEALARTLSSLLGEGAVASSR